MGCATLALGLGGCSFSHQLDAMFVREREAETASIQSTASRPKSHGEIGAAARAAVSEALSKDGRDASVSWDNPATGARGTVTPLSSAYSLDGATCRDFLASYVRNGSEEWLQGEACRGARGRWEVRAMRPWQRS